MGAVFAAAARAPMTAVISILELTGEYQLILPLMLAVALAAGTGPLLSRDTIFRPPHPALSPEGRRCGGRPLRGGSPRHPEVGSTRTADVHPPADRAWPAR